MKTTFFALLLCISAFAAQAPRPIGVIQRIDAAGKSLVIKTDGGPELRISFDEATRFLRVAPGARDLEGATPLTLADLGAGDRILARGKSGDAGAFAATSIIVISQADLAKKHAADRAEWERRGIGGVVTALNPAAREITIRAAAPMVVAFAPGARFRRYAPNSVKFSDAVPSRFEDLKVGDQIKALGTASEDRARFTAEELVSGSFRTIAATIAAVDAPQSTLQLTDLATNKRLQAALAPDSVVRRLTPENAQWLSARIKGSAPAGDLQSMLEKLPQLRLTDLKPGDALILSCGAGDDPARVTAIVVLAGVEPALKASAKPGQTVNLGSWNLDLNLTP